jgi:ubiquinone/menaquinone biosynthesis C-methylase UbiE
MRFCQTVFKRYLTSLYIAMRNERRAAQEMLMEPDPDAWLLDCGCREGDNTVKLAKCVGTRQILGLDYNLTVLRQAAQRGISSLQADLNCGIPLEDSSVDVIVASDVLEHLVDPYVFVGEMYRVLQPGGYLVLDTPNLASWHNVFALLIGVQPFSGPNITAMEDADVELVQQMHRSTRYLPGEGEQLNHGKHELARHIVVIAYVSLVKLFERWNFQLEQVRGFGYYPLPVPLARIFQRLDPRHTHHVLIKARKPQG